jgi:hypothetical protein
LFRSNKFIKINQRIINIHIFLIPAAPSSRLRITLVVFVWSCAELTYHLLATHYYPGEKGYASRESNFVPFLGKKKKMKRYIILSSFSFFLWSYIILLLQGKRKNLSGQNQI